MGIQLAEKFLYTEYRNGTREYLVDYLRSDVKVNKALKRIWNYCKNCKTNLILDWELKIVEYLIDKTAENLENSWFTRKHLQEKFNKSKNQIEKFCYKLLDVGIIFEISMSESDRRQKEFCLNLAWEIEDE